ncbi:MAG: hypothetical protein WC822_01220 [Candidatus Paceibacterota bacterium]|jgi:hypothetical protein
MGKSIHTELRDIREMVERIANGEFPVRSPIGPGQIQSKNIRARAVTAPLINVDNLEAVNTKTGDLTVDGTITVSTDGKIVSGTDTATWADFTTSPGGGQGYYHTYDATYGALVAFGDFNNVTGQYVKWDGSALTIKGAVIASAGSIAGWTILADSIESGEVGMASSGHSGVAFWAGSLVPTSAEFYVTATGELYATSATITGAITATSGRLDDLSVRGILELGPSGVVRTAGTTGWNSGSGLYYDYNTGAPRFSLGNTSSSAGLAWSTAAGLEVKGTITATSGSFSGDVVVTGGNAGFRAGQTAYNTGTGFWLGNVGGSPRFSIGNGSTENLTWNGSALTVRGTLNADDGYLNTLSLTGPLTLTTSSSVIQSTGASYGSTGLFLGYSGAAYKFSLGNKLTFDGSNLSINGGGTFSGALSAASGSFAGSLTAATGSLGALSIAGALTFGGGGSISLPGSGTITSSTLDINSGNMGGLTVDGNITVGTGGAILFGSGADDYLDDDILHFTITSTQAGKVRMQKAATNRHAILYSYDDAANVYSTLGVTTSAPVSNYNSVAFKAMVDLSSAGVAHLQAVDSGGTVVNDVYVDAVNDRVRLIATDIRFEGKPYFQGSDTTAAGTYYGRVPVTFNGLTKYLHLFNA